MFPRVFCSRTVLAVGLICTAFVNVSRAADTSEQANGGLAEIVVTAQKQVERLQDVPVPVGVISAEALLDTNAVRLEDFYNRIPGLNLSNTGTGITEISIRGLTTGDGNNPTVGITIDDLPFGTTRTAGYSVVPDIDPENLARIEVLRGPQGTLYGASSLGGLIKYVTLDPSFDSLSARVSVDANGTVLNIVTASAMGCGVRSTCL
jgi:iron complex outermembrane receptor protein